MEDPSLTWPMSTPSPHLSLLQCWSSCRVTCSVLSLARRAGTNSLIILSPVSSMEPGTLLVLIPCTHTLKKKCEWNRCRSTGKRKSGSGWARTVTVGGWVAGKQGGGQTQQQVSGFLFLSVFSSVKWGFYRLLMEVLWRWNQSVKWKLCASVTAGCWLPAFPGRSVCRLLGAEEKGKVQFEGGKVLFSTVCVSFCV